MMRPIHTESARTTREFRMSSVALHRVATYGYARRSTITCASKKAARKAKGAPKQKAQPPPVQKVDDSVDVTTSDSNPDVTPTPEVNPYSSAGYEGDNFIPYGNTSGAALRITDVMLSVGDVDLLTEASVAVMPGQVVGLVGGNGCGKSTLLKCIAGRRSVQDGEIAIAKELEVGYFEQTAVSGSQKTVYEEARSQMHRINAAKAALDAAEKACESTDDVEACKAADSLMDALAEFEAAGGYEAEKRIANVLDGLGFARTQWEVRCDDLSGGWQMRVALARLLLSPAGSGEKGLLLLDEPTNHLDIPAKQMLEDALLDYEGAALLVSHDRTFISRVANRIVELRDGGLVLYRGDYAYYQEKKEEEAELLRAAEEEAAREAKRAANRAKQKTKAGNRRKRPA